MNRRDADPESYIQERDDHHRLEDEGDRRGTRGERSLEDQVYGVGYRERYENEQANKAKVIPEPVRTMPFDVLFTYVNGSGQYYDDCGCTWDIVQKPLTICKAHSQKETSS